MKKYEYKFVKEGFKFAFDFDKRIEEVEHQWNELGKQGWKFCKEVNGVMIFIREIDE
jgi:hypothetical protein